VAGRTHRPRLQEEAEKEVVYALGEYADVIESYLAIPVMTGIKSDSEKFAGADYTQPWKP